MVKTFKKPMSVQVCRDVSEGALKDRNAEKVTGALGHRMQRLPSEHTSEKGSCVCFKHCLGSILTEV